MLMPDLAIIEVTSFLTIYRNELWWQSGNMVETLARFGIEDADFKQTAIDIVSNTYEKSRNQMGAKDWKNDFYDDMGW